MIKRKRIREKGKIKLSQYFQKLEKGDKVSIIREVSVATGTGFPKSIQGRSGVVEGEKGSCYIIKIKMGKDKKFIIHPIHLKKLKSQSLKKIK